MSTYFCYACARTLGLYTPPANAASLNLTGNLYTLGKFMEHTVYGSGLGKHMNSFYANPTYDAYKDHYVNTSASGSLEVQPDGKKNLIWYAGTPLGPAFENGSFKFSGEAVKVVYPENTGKLHHFHVNAHDYTSQLCSLCHKPILS
jgi:hypothetical protein